MKAAVMVGGVTIAMLASLLVLIVVGSSFPAIVSPSLLALTFGLRHAVDADHIAVIDNVTRKLVEDGQRPLTVGLFFSLGHSTVVVIVCILVASGSGYAADKYPDFTKFAGLWGPAFSSAVLLLFGIFNGWTAVRLWRKWRKLRAAGRTGTVTNSTIHEHDEDDDSAAHTHVVAVDADARVEGPGCLTKSRCCRTIFASIDRPWKIFPVGFLFGLGFDTATQISLLAVTASVGASDVGVHWSATLLLPLMFTCGMSLLDTLNGIFMLWTYGWANLDLMLQVWFNFSLTAASAFIAVVVAFFQVVGIVQEEFKLEGPGWEPVVAFGEHSDIVGLSVVAFFILSLAAAFLYGRLFLTGGGGSEKDAPAVVQTSTDVTLNLDGAVPSEVTSSQPL